MNKQRIYVLLLASLFLSFASFLIVIFDKSFTFKWLALCLSLVPLSIITGLWIVSLAPYKKALRSISRFNFAAILLIAVISRFFLLVDYPFVSVGDEIRDGGLDAMKIAIGFKSNIFGYGTYESHGLIIPTVTSIFYKSLGNSVLVYRLPSALVSILDILVIYVLLSVLTKNKMASFLGAMVLVSLPLHLFYSRTEIVVILSSLFSSLILFGLFVFIRRKMINLVDYIYLGALLGFTFNLHASIKAFGIIVFAIILFMCFYQWFSGKLNMKQVVIRLLFLILFLFVGFGPRLLNTPDLNRFLNMTRLSFVSEGHSKFISDDLKQIGEQYKKSLLVWITEPTKAWYPEHKPILSPVLFILMIIGVCVTIYKRNVFLFLTIVISLVLHLTNSALTDILNGDHRLSPLFPIGALFVGVGIALLMDIIRLKCLRILLFLSFFIFLIYQSVLFFYNQPANLNKNTGDYVSMNAIYFIKANYKLFKSSKLIFFVSPHNYHKYSYMHYKEQFIYFLPSNKIDIQQSIILNDNEIFIKRANYNSLNNNIIIKCSDLKYRCPINSKTNIGIYY